MKDYWIITERGNEASLLNNGFSLSSSFLEDSGNKLHIYLAKKKIFPFYDSEEPDDFDIYIKNFDINKYNQLSLLMSLVIPIEEALKELT